MHDRARRGGPAGSWRWRWPRLAALVGVLAVGMAVAACSGSATSTTSAGTSSSDDRQMALNWARCMRQHGINLPDPQFSGDDVDQQLPDREVRESAKFKAAQEACRQVLPNGGQPSPPSAQERQQALAFARCMRQHGITNMPDPKIVADGGIQQVTPRIDADDPRVKAAEQACHQYGSLGPPKPGGSQNGGGGK